ncbi:UDP-glucose 4-epimerase GalE [Streptomyces griseomycini]|uniref:UDP-glucose 4-epimerase n=1 Tax=Streptomyces griseomycini TaxID=66895 RepID=A0A7W7PTX8_9ACTN|nr:UDP-glucose 4-epimerase GalE [Streptomyces griseomycini]MBB4901190.1 UDP-glucose 4-epimerase [Streptomyces griseomycini]GGP88991.1 UDP-glucose 4-epimerase GalE [Streptomyces griseomycini]GGR17542.1 UDP-glucose 4-epimerase GalE [Streptomyces griseomycini]
MTWLITGGAGYIGAHVVRALTGAGERAVVYDDLSTGLADRVPDGVPLVTGSTLDGERVARVLAEHAVTGVVHLAAKKQVAESVERPLHYYRENVEGLRVLLDAVTAAGVPSFVFSSSASVYGVPGAARDDDLVTEETPCAPVSPYGETKLAGEWLVRATGRATGLSTACLRYFNVAGAASPDLADVGVSNLIPMVFEKLTEGVSPRVFGDDYPTPDGTCVRDYIHVVDLAEAHVAAARALRSSPGRDLTLNIGRGEGVSVREMIDRVNALTGHDRPPVVAARRPGDPPRVVASADRAAAELGWKARHGIDDMITSAWAGWTRLHPAAAHG